MLKIIFLFISYFIFINNSYAILNIDIVGGKEDNGKLAIAIVPFAQQTGMQSLPQNIAGIVSKNLQSSGLFDPLAIKDLPEQPFYAPQVNFARWQAINMPYLVIGRAISGKTGIYNIEFELFDVYDQKRLIGLAYKATTQTLKQVSNKITDDIYYALIGKRGIFSTRIAYVSVHRQNGQKPQYHLSIADANGENPQLMLRSNEPVFSPSWSPDGKSIAYVTYSNIAKRKRMAIYIQEISTGKQILVSAYRGLNAAPAWSPDGQYLALTLSKDNNPEIYLYIIKTRQFKRLTNNKAIDTEAEWAPDGKSIVFTSDRYKKKPQIYRVGVNGGKVRRLTLKGSYNARARFSPDGSKLTFLHQKKGQYQIAVLSLKTKKLKIVSKTKFNDSPSFAPNGELIIYSTGNELATVSVDGKIQKRLTIPISEVREPTWSPFTQ